MLNGLGEEKSIILMLNSPDCLVDGMAVLTGEHYFDATNKQVFGIMKSVYDEGKPVTMLTIAEQCRRIQGFNLARYMSATFATKGEMSYLCDQLEDIRQGRQAYRILQDGMENMKDSPTMPVIEKIQEQLFLVSAKDQRDEIVSGKEMAVRAIGHIDQRSDADRPTPLYTQYGKLNKMIGSFEQGDLVIISAPTGSGKSAFTQNIFKHLSVSAKIPGLYINTEMSEEQMSLRWAAMLSKNITHSQLRAGKKLEKEERENLLDGLDRLYTSKFACVTIPDLTIDRVASVVRRYKKSHDVQIVAVDYIGRMDTTNAKLREDQVLLNAAKRLKTLAQQCKVVMFMVAQVRKDGQLQSASYMENEADLHLRLEPMDEEEVNAMIAKLLPWNYRLYVAKGRNCQKGWSFMQFNGEKLTFYGEEAKT